MYVHTHVRAWIVRTFVHIECTYIGLSLGRVSPGRSNNETTAKASQGPKIFGDNRLSGFFGCEFPVILNTPTLSAALWAKLGE